MSEVFRAMKTVDFEWKILSPFHVYCRSRKPKEQIKLSLQLYKIDDQYYLLDFKNLTLPPLINSTSELPEPSDNIRPDYGHSYENVGVITLQFFEQCALLIRELAVSRS
jgi:5'-AMP-activated protein kinase catalytic alpha subunit